MGLSNQLIKQGVVMALLGVAAPLACSSDVNDDFDLLEASIALPAGRGICHYVAAIERPATLNAGADLTAPYWAMAALHTGSGSCPSETEVELFPRPTGVPHAFESVKAYLGDAHLDAPVISLGVVNDIFLDGFEARPPAPAPGSITMRSDSIRTYNHLDFLYAWHESLVRMYGDRPRLVSDGVNPRVPDSFSTFTGGVAGDSFGFRLSGVADWDTEAAIEALGRGEFEAYVASRLSGDDGVQVDRHADFSGLKLGFGVNSSVVQTDQGDGVNRTDRVSQPGEALVLTIDTDGTYQPDPNLPGNTHYEFVPDTAPFVNSGLDEQSALVLSNIHLEPVNVNPQNISCSVDYFIFDVSEQAVIRGRSGEPGQSTGVLLASLDAIGTLPGSWIVDDGDIVVLAYNKDTRQFNDDGGGLKHSWGLWSMTWDLIDR